MAAKYGGSLLWKSLGIWFFLKMTFLVFHFFGLNFRIFPISSFFAIWYNWDKNVKNPRLTKKIDKKNERIIDLTGGKMAVVFFGAETTIFLIRV